MEENSDLEHVSGSSTGGESGFVHVESIESASTDGSAINQQDDGVVVTRVDSGEDESSDLRLTDDGGNEEFVDCPDDLLSNDGRTDFDESQEAEVLSEDNQHTLFDSKSEILPHHYQQEERQQLMTELTNLRHKLKVLIKKNPLIDGNDGALFTYELAAATVAGDDKSLWPLHEMIFDCSRFVELALGEQSQAEHTVRELYATLDTKDKEINDLNVKVFELSSVETTTDRILSSLANSLSLEEFLDTSVSGKILHLENITSFLIQKHGHFLSEVQMLNQYLAELKRKELELTHKSSHLEDEYRKLMEQLYKGQETIAMLNSEIGRLKGEVEVEKTRYSNTREKLNLAVTKGKSLVQQRDSLKQAIVEKTSELDKCLFELQEKSSALETAELRKKEMVQIEALANSLKDQSFQLQDEINTMKEAARLKIDRLTISLLIEAQEKNYIEEEFADLTQKVSKELCVLKDKNGYLKIDLQRSEDKAALLREKLSMAVKKGKALVQERESMKQEIAEKNANIEALNLELKQQEDRISKLSSDVKRIIKLESDLLHSKEERDQIEQFVVESNTILQRIVDATDEIVLPVHINEPLEKVKWCVSYLNECQVSKAQAEQELRDVKDEASMLASKLTDSLEAMKSLEDALSVSEKHVFQLTEEKRELEILKTNIEEGLHNAMEECHISKTQAEKTITTLTEQKQELEVAKSCIEEKLHKAVEEATSQTSEFEEIVASRNSLQEMLSLAEKKISVLMQEKEDAQASTVAAERELQNVKDEVSNQLHKAVEEATSQTNKFEEIVASRNSLQEMLSLAEKNISVLMQEKEDAQASTVAAERELQNVKDEVSIQLQAHISQFSHENEMAQNNRNLLESEIKKLKDETSYHEQKFLDASITIRTLEDALLKANNTVSNLLGEKKNAEKLHKAVEEATSQTSKFEEIVASRNSLQEMLSLAEKKISVLMQEKEDAQASTVAAERELQNVKDEVSTQLQAHISQFSHENEMAQNNRNLLESEIKKLKDESSYHEQKFLDASITIRTLEDALLKANNTVSNLLGEKKNAEQEISTLSTQLSACRQELACKHDDWASDFSSFLENLQVLLKDGTLLILFNQSIEKKIEIFIEMDHHLKDIKDYFDSEQLQGYPAIEESFQLSTLLPTRFDNILSTETTNDNGADATNIKSYAGNVLEKLNMRNQILSDEFIRFSTFIDELTTSLLLKLEAIKNTMPITLKQTKTLQKNVHDLQIDKQVQEKKILIMSGEITELQAELEKTRSTYDKVKEENDILQNRVSKLDTELEASQTMRDELGNKLQDYQAKEDEWDRREAELSKQLTSFVKDHDAENRRGVTEASPLPSHSEISEVEDPVSIGKRSMPLARTLRRGSNDHLALNIDPESDHLIGKEETLQDKGHVFKSLHTSGLVPPQGKIIADRLDGIWVSGGGALMSRPRARLGLIAYWLVLHLWLVGTLL